MFYYKILSDRREDIPADKVNQSIFAVMPLLETGEDNLECEKRQLGGLELLGQLGPSALHLKPRLAYWAYCSNFESVREAALRVLEVMGPASEGNVTDILNGLRSETDDQGLRRLDLITCWLNMLKEAMGQIDPLLMVRDATQIMQVTMRLGEKLHGGLEAAKVADPEIVEQYEEALKAVIKGGFLKKALGRVSEQSNASQEEKLVELERETLDLLMKVKRSGPNEEDKEVLGCFVAWYGDLSGDRQVGKDIYELYGYIKNRCEIVDLQQFVEKRPKTFLYLCSSFILATLYTTREKNSGQAIEVLDNALALPAEELRKFHKLNFLINIFRGECVVARMNPASLKSVDNIVDELPRDIERLKAAAPVAEHIDQESYSGVILPALAYAYTLYHDYEKAIDTYMKCIEIAEDDTERVSSVMSMIHTYLIPGIHESNESQKWMDYLEEKIPGVNVEFTQVEYPAFN
ncbi:hypothetical protein ACFL4D_02340 [Candidatus Margulisiibacteriota bacterium]